MGVVRIHFATGGNYLVRHAIAGFHEVAFIFFIQDLDFRQPLAGGRSDPSWNQGACGIAMMPRKRSAIHSQSNQCVQMHSFLNRYAPNERGHLTGNFIRATKRYMLASALYACPLEKITQAHTLKACRPDGSPLPLHTWNFRSLEGATVSSTFKRVGDGVRRHFPEIEETEIELVLYFAPNIQPPFRGLPCVGFVHMISDEEMRYRSKPTAEVNRRHFQIKKSGGTHDHP